MSNPVVDPPTKPSKGEKTKFRLDEVLIDNFPSEKVVEEYFFENIDKMMETIFDETVVYSKRQLKVRGLPYLVKGMSGGMTRSFRCKARFDIYVKCKSGKNYILEFKNPKSSRGHEDLTVVTQLLYYSTIYPEANRFVVISTKYLEGFKEVISKYNLPIEFILFTKGQCFLLQKNDNN